MLNISKNAEKALEMLRSSGYEAYVVGGCVRDMVMGLPANDFDITTSAFPEETKQVFSGYNVIETGIQHGTVAVVMDGEVLEITTYRIDGEYRDGRHPDSVEFTRNLKDDLSRRDFTMNALSYNHGDGVIDCFDGIKDINAKIIRAIGDPKKRFCEDALRIMRAIRFSSTLGFQIESETRKAMLECKHLLDNVSVERIAVELNKFLLGKNVKNAILENYEILGYICPELEKMYKFNQHSKWHAYDALEHTALSVASCPQELHLRLAMLFHDVGKMHTFFRDETGEGHFYGHAEKSAQIVKELLNRYKYSNFYKERVYTLVKYHDLQTELDSVLIKKRLNRLGKDVFLDLIEIQRADNAAQSPDKSKKDHLSALESLTRQIASESCFSLSNLEINGGVLIASGIEKGKKIGEILNALLSEVIENKIPNEKNELLKRAKEIYSKI